MEAEHQRARSELREGTEGRSKQSMRTCISPAGSIDKALRGVKKDMRDLWIRSRYIPELAGIATFSPSIQVKSSEKKQKTAPELPIVKASTPFHVTVQKKAQTHREQFSVSHHLRVSSPNPAFPSQKPKQIKGYILKKIPQPLFLQRSNGKPCGKKGEIRALGDFIKGEIERSIVNMTEDCPLTALRSYELERKSRDIRAFSSFELSAKDGNSPLSFPTARQSFLTQPLRFRTRPLAAHLPAWNDTCLKISKLTSYSAHKKAASQSLWQFHAIPHLSSDGEDALLSSYPS